MDEAGPPDRATAPSPGHVFLDGHWRQVVETLPDIVWISHDDGSNVHVNQRWVSFTGLDAESSAGFGWVRAIHPRDRDAARDAWAAVSPDGSTFEVRYRLRNVDGDYRWMLGRTAPIRVDGQRYWLGTCTDIEELTRAQTLLEQGRGLRRLAGQIARLGGWSVAADTFEVTWSSEIAQILEHPDGERFDARSTLDLYETDAYDRIQKAVLACLEDGTPFDLEVPMRTFRDRPIWARLIGEARRDVQGRITHLQGALQDVTDEVAIRHRATELADRLTTTLESVTDAFYLVNPQWRFTYLNSHAQQLLRRSADELEGRVLWEEFPGTLATELEHAYRYAAATGQPAHIEEYHYPPLDTWFQVDAYPSSEGLAVYFRDVTDRRRATDDLRRAHAELARMNEQLEEAARIKDDLLSMASHELRTPLTPILGFLELFLERGENLTDRQLQMVDSMRRNATRMLHLVDDLLVVSRASADVLVARPQDLRVADVLEPVLDGLGTSMSPARLDVGDHRMLADPNHVQHVVLNLLTNATKYGKGPVEISAHTAGPGRVRIEVADHGPGVPESFRERMWDRFSQKDRGDTRTATGTGLGLAIVRLLAEANGGSVEYRDAEPTGAVFSVLLPAPSEADPT